MFIHLKSLKGIMNRRSGVLSSKKSDAPTRRKGISISVYVFFLLLVLSIVPMMIISFINLQNVQKRLASMELEYEEDLLQLLISPVEARINIYEELIRFVSQLPAVMEILDSGRRQGW